MTYKHAIVVGASSGIGEAIAKQLASDGTRVTLIARRSQELERIEQEIAADGGHAFHHVHDVRDFDAAPRLFERIASEFEVDLIVYAAGAMPPVEENEFNFEKDHTIIDVNVLGAMAWLNPAASYFEQRQAGTVIGISSIAGERGRMGNPAYCSSKAAFTTYLEALRNRLHRLGVSIVTIKPGFVDTAMTRGMKGLLWLISAEEAARQILSLAKRRRSASGFIPWRWSVVAMVVRNIPSFVFRRTKI